MLGFMKDVAETRAWKAKQAGRATEDPPGVRDSPGVVEFPCLWSDQDPGGCWALVFFFVCSLIEVQLVTGNHC